MKILLVSWFFPPLNEVAALRTGAFAEFFSRNGHTVRVLTADRSHPDASLALRVPDWQISRTPYFDVDNPLQKKLSHPTISSAPTRQIAIIPKPSAVRKLRATASEAYQHLAHIPDRQIGWFPYAVRRGSQMLKADSVDLIYASAPPFTTHLIAKSLSDKFGVPWIAEYRDAWSHYLYQPRPRWRRLLDTSLENRTVSSAAAIVAVSEPWADCFQNKFKKPTLAVYNGYDSAMISQAEHRSGREDPLSISYLGVLYGGIRNPSPLYNAIWLSALSPQDLRVKFYGASPQEVLPLATSLGVVDFVDTMPRVSFQESILLQRQSDILLLLQSSEDERNVPAKLFEYFAARRPILGIGLDNGVPARLIRSRNAGYYGSDPDGIAQQLGAWIAEKRAGGVPDIPDLALQGLARQDQLKNLEEFLTSFVRSGHEGGYAHRP